MRAASGAAMADFKARAGARALILKPALATATDAVAIVYRCPAWMRFAMGDAVQVGGVYLPLTVLVLSN